jgi:hypothetical protein
VKLWSSLLESGGLVRTVRTWNLKPTSAGIPPVAVYQIAGNAVLVGAGTRTVAPWSWAYHLSRCTSMQLEVPLLVSHISTAGVGPVCRGLLLATGHGSSVLRDPWSCH